MRVTLLTTVKPSVHSAYLSWECSSPASSSNLWRVPWLCSPDVIELPLVSWSFFLLAEISYFALLHVRTRHCAIPQHPQHSYCRVLPTLPCCPSLKLCRDFVRSVLPETCHLSVGRTIPISCCSSEFFCATSELYQLAECGDGWLFHVL